MTPTPHIPGAELADARLRNWWTKPYSYQTIGGGTAVTTNADELKLALVAAPFVIAALIAAGALFLVGVLAVDMVLFG